MQPMVIQTRSQISIKTFKTTINTIYTNPNKAFKTTMNNAMYNNAKYAKYAISMSVYYYAVSQFISTHAINMFEEC